MSELRSAVEALRAETLPDLPDGRIEQDFAELQQTVELLEVERLRRLAEIERRRLFERDGHLSAASWLASAFRVAWGHRPRARADRPGAGADAPDPSGAGGRRDLDVARARARAGARYGP